MSRTAQLLPPFPAPSSSADGCLLVLPCLEEALDRLAAGRLVPSLPDALAYLTLRQENAELLAVYRERFPDQWSHSAAACVPFRGGYAPREVELFHLIHDHLFPLADVFLDAVDNGTVGDPHDGEWDGDEADAHVPGRYRDIDFWPLVPHFHEVELDGFTLGCQLLMLIEQGVESAETLEAVRPLTTPQRAGLAAVYRELAPWLRADWATLERRAGDSAIAALRKVPAALMVLNHETENPWIDLACEGCSQPETSYCWCRACIAELTEAYQGAKQLLDDFDAVCAWLAASPVAHTRKVLQLWYTPPTPPAQRMPT